MEFTVLGEGKVFNAPYKRRLLRLCPAETPQNLSVLDKKVPQVTPTLGLGQKSLKCPEEKGIMS